MQASSEAGFNMEADSGVVAGGEAEKAGLSANQSN
jgi:hypothetical protein